MLPLVVDAADGGLPRAEVSMAACRHVSQLLRFTALALRSSAAAIWAACCHVESLEVEVRTGAEQAKKVKDQ